MRVANVKTLKKKIRLLNVLYCTLLIFIILLLVQPLLNEFNEANMKEAMFQLKAWKNDYKALLESFQDACTDNKYLSSKNNSQVPVVQKLPPPLQYEEFRRRVYINMKDLWYFFDNALKESYSEENSMAEFIKKGKRILDIVAHRKLSLLADMEKLEEEDGWHEWRKRKAAEDSNLVQHRLNYIQTLLKEAPARKCFCNTFPFCGYGCQIHQLIICLINGYATGRPVEVIIGKKFTNYSVLSMVKAAAALINYDKNFTDVTVVADLDIDKEYLPLAVPKDLSNSVIRFNGDPASWWIGQYVKFVLKPLPHVQAVINNTISKLNFKTPIVGVHIRRTDKLFEAASHSVEEYMYHVKDYYNKLEIKNHVTIVLRRVYLATDDLDVVNEALLKFPNYQFLYDQDVVKTANPTSRWTQEGMIGLLVDVNLLAMCDFFVGTFSSQVGKLVYEIMQANRYDASNSYFSLDDIYFFPIMQIPHNRIAVISHIGDNNTISFQAGDLIGVAGNHWDGYGKGINRRTNESGLFPWYKTSDHLVMYPFPRNNHIGCA